MLYRIIDNENGAILALCFDEDTAKKILSLYPKDAKVSDDEETIRYVYEDCFQHCAGHADQIGDTLVQLGRHIQWGRKRYQ